MKYRIILEESGNDKHYEVQFYERCWYGHKWVNTTKYRNSGFDEFYIKASYDTLEEARHVVYERDETCST